MDPDRNRHLQSLRRSLHRLQLAGLQVYRVLEQAPVNVAAQPIVVAGTQAPNPLRVAGNPRLGKGDQLGPASRGFVQELDATRQRLLSVEGYRGMLDDGDSVWARGLFWHAAMLLRCS